MHRNFSQVFEIISCSVGVILVWLEITERCSLEGCKVVHYAICNNHRIQ